VCRRPAFGKRASDTDQSLIGTATSMVVENNYGYSGPTATSQGRTTTPGLARVNIRPGGRGCRIAWVSKEVAPSVVPKLSLGAGLVYTYTKDTDSHDPWYLTALDYRTGKTVFKVRAGSGIGYNNNYAPVTLGPDATAYVGTLGGLVALRDSQ
jgi:outer membrane protein assembly factor BamB